MARTLVDADLNTWEAYSAPDRFGFPARARIVFHCVSDRFQRPRWVGREVAVAAAEREIGEMSDAELTALLEEAQELR